MGKINWYMPHWLNKLVPHLSIEGGEFFRARDESAPAPAQQTPASAVAE